jgi:hypothetical protein
VQGFDSPDFWAHVLQPGTKELFKQYEENCYGENVVAQVP